PGCCRGAACRAPACCAPAPVPAAPGTNTSDAEVTAGGLLMRSELYVRRALLRSVAGTLALSNDVPLAGTAIISRHPMRSLKLSTLYSSDPLCAVSSGALRCISKRSVGRPPAPGGKLSAGLLTESCAGRPSTE